MSCPFELAPETLEEREALSFTVCASVERPSEIACSLAACGSRREDLVGQEDGIGDTGDRLNVGATIAVRDEIGDLARIACDVQTLDTLRAMTADCAAFVAKAELMRLKAAERVIALDLPDRACHRLRGEVVQDVGRYSHQFGRLSNSPHRRFAR